MVSPNPPNTSRRMMEQEDIPGKISPEAPRTAVSVEFPKTKNYDDEEKHSGFSMLILSKSHDGETESNIIKPRVESVRRKTDLLKALPKIRIQPRPRRLSTSKRPLNCEPIQMHQENDCALPVLCEVNTSFPCFTPLPPPQKRLRLSSPPALNYYHAHKGVVPTSDDLDTKIYLPLIF